MNLDQVTAAYGEANVKAFLRLLRERESNQEDDAYTIINGGTHFTVPPWVHPYAGQSAPPGRAAGAYQYIPHTWDRVSDALGFGGVFSPINQDLGAVYLIAGRHALDDVLGGRIADACAKCRSEWTSLPGAAEASASWTLEKALAVYRHWGGTIAGQPAPIEEATPGAATVPQQGKDMGAGLIIGLIQTALQAFSPLAAQKIQSELGKHTDPTTANAIAGNVMSAIQQATGHLGNTPEAMIAATAAITAKDAPQTVVQTAQEDALARLDRIAPFVDKLAALDQAAWAGEESSRGAASDRAQHDTIDLATPLTYAGLGTIGLLIIFVGAIIIVQTVQHGTANTESWAALTGIIGWVTGQVTGIFSYRFGTTRTSGAKDVLISELAKK